MKTYQVREGSYSTREDVVVEVIEEVVEQKQTAVTEANILKTIANLEQKKTDFCTEVDREISVNKEMLTEVRNLNEDVQLV